MIISSIENTLSVILVKKQPLWQRLRIQWFLGEWQLYRKWVWRQWHWTERGQRIRNQTLINSCNPSTEVKFCAFMGDRMNKYVVFIKSDESRVLRKEVVTREIIKDMKQKGFRKHHVEVDAENENDAINKLNKNSNDYLDSLRNFSGDLLLCSIFVIAMVMVYLFR
ncbi:hypothetical protein SME38J_16610 [Serratia marcescens]|nr:hypothetical protein SME38J_16610 [Serratia marcescens]